MFIVVVIGIVVIVVVMDSHDGLSTGHPVLHVAACLQQCKYFGVWHSGLGMESRSNHNVTGIIIIIVGIVVIIIIINISSSRVTNENASDAGGIGKGVSVSDAG